MMKILILTSMCWAILTTALGQDAQVYFEQGIEKANTGELEEALKAFDKSIELNDSEYAAWYYRGILKSWLYLPEEALADFEQTIKLYPDFAEAYFQRGSTRKLLTDYEGAMEDYNYAIQLDPNYAEAYFYRGRVYEMFSKIDSACLNFKKAKELGLESAYTKVEICNDTTIKRSPIHPILRLTQTAKDATYGFTSENPIRVGSGPDGGPANQIAYLNLIRDQQGKPVQYNRLSSCCHYKSENGIMGIAMLDKYEISYLDEKGAAQKSTLYLTFYDYEEPKVLVGFKTLGHK